MFASNSSQVSSDAVFIEDVFSTYLYTGNATARSITNGIDLAGKGGMVWFKDRSQAYGNRVFDTNRGTNKLITTNTTAAEFSSYTNMLTAFNADGFSIGDDSNAIGLNVNSDLMVSWTFRKQPKFFDVVTWTGDGTTSRLLNHNLQSYPGCIIVKRTDTTSDWQVLHRVDSSTPYTYDPLKLNATSASTYTAVSNMATDTQFQVGTNFQFGLNKNVNGGTYVAYLFAHNAGGFGLAGTDNVISCGSYNGNGTTTGPVITLNYEPQWVLIKRNDPNGYTGPWMMYDTMRGMPNGSNAAYLYANTSEVEGNSGWGMVRPLATGFQPMTDDPWLNASGSPYIYIAIRRGPMKTPTSGTSVFETSAWTGNATSGTRLITGFGYPTDLAIFSDRQNIGGYQNVTYDRLRNTNSTGGLYLITSSTATEGTNLNSTSYVSAFQQNNGFLLGDVTFNYSGRTYVGWQFGRAPGFMDVVCYTGTGSNTTVTHNLGVAPELMIVKRRSTTNAWAVYANNDNTDYLVLNTSAATVDDNTYWNDTSPTNTVFSVGTNNAVNASGSTYVAYLFATCPGVSKVGSYTGSGTTKQIDCGFTGGARFVLIKRTDSTGDWYVWDTARGIVSGNDPYILLNSTAAEVTNTDYIDAYSAGFEISSTAPAAINASGGTFVFFAIS